MIVAQIAILILTFYFLAEICDEFFVPALEKIAEKWRISSEVAGATLMAVGSSAPELFTSIFAVFWLRENAGIGAGTIVGSAIFNILVIVGASAIFMSATKKTKLFWQPVLRDLIFYFLTILLLLFCFWDGKIIFVETIFLVIFYFLYLFAVKNWGKWLKYEIPKNKNCADFSPENLILQKICCENFKNFDKKKIEKIAEFLNLKKNFCAKNLAEKFLIEKNLAEKIAEKNIFVKKNLVKISVFCEKNNFKKEICVKKIAKILEIEKNLAKKIWENFGKKSGKNFAKKLVHKFLNLFFSEKNFWWNFLGSIFLIGFLTHFMVHAAVAVATFFAVPPTIIGLTILAAGTSVPDLLSSIAVAKKGKGDMAVSNAVGSNIFDILCGLGFVYFFYFLFFPAREIPVDTENLLASVFLLIATVVAIFFVLIFQKWHLGKFSGFALIFLYFFYLIFSVVRIL